MADMMVMPVNHSMESKRLRRLIRQSLSQSEEASLAKLRGTSASVQPRLSEQELQALARALVPRLRRIQQLHFSR